MHVVATIIAVNWQIARYDAETKRTEGKVIEKATAWRMAEGRWRRAKTERTRAVESETAPTVTFFAPDNIVMTARRREEICSFGEEEPLEEFVVDLEEFDELFVIGFIDQRCETDLIAPAATIGNKKKRVRNSVW